MIIKTHIHVHEILINGTKLGEERTYPWFILGLIHIGDHIAILQDLNAVLYEL